MNSRWIALACALLGTTAAAAPPAVPEQLEPWRQWVLDGQQYRRCPFLAGENLASREAFVCAWPGRLTLDVQANGASFSQRWQVHAESWVALPGDAEHWPRAVTLNGVAAPVVARNRIPHLYLAPGMHAVSGELRWTRRPESLPVPAQTALIDLSVDGQRIAQPERPGNAVWLGKRRAAEQQEQLEVQVYRRVDDQVPVRLTTSIRLQVAGDGREELLARALPDDFVPLSLDSELPARIEPDGRLRVQVRAGSWQITLQARGAGEARTLSRPPTEGPWAREEIWSFAGDDRLRVVAVEGVEGVDPVQTAVPEEWRQLPAYRMAPDSQMRIVERARGISAADENQLRLQRTLWLDFDGHGYTAVDQLSGMMRQDWRLDMQEPQRLLSASTGGENLLVTRGPADGRTGVELRDSTVNLTGVSRIEQGGALSATGWTNRFDSVSGTLNLPPGHRLLAVAGADSAPSAWLERWRLLDVFLVLLVSVAAARMFGWPVGVLTLVALALTQHDSDGMVWLWLNLLLAAVLARAAQDGRLREIASFYRAAAFAVLVLMLLPYTFNQVRLGLYPQLAHGAYVMPASAPPVAPPEVAMEMHQRKAVSDESSVVVTGSRVPARAEGYGLNAQQVKQRYAPGTLVQTGPGVPSWRYNTHQFSWSGPVSEAQSVRFVYLTPFWLGTWRILGCLLLAALLVLIAGDSFGRPRLPAWLVRWRTAAPIVILVLLPLGVLAPLQSSHAQIPDEALRQELKTRLTRAPECAPVCGDLMSARVRATANQLDVVLEVSALEALAVPVPHADKQWEIESIAVDGQPTGLLYRDPQGRRWVAVGRGAHEVRLAGRVTAGEALTLVFPMRPHAVAVSAEGWEASGMGDGRLLTDTLELLRRTTAAAGAARAPAGREFPPFVRVQRHVALDLDWSVHTSVLRVAPEKGAFTLAVPLLIAESVLTEGIEVRPDRTAVVAMPAGESRVHWSSGLPRAERLELQFVDGTARSEVWSFAVSPEWHVEFEGVPAVLPHSPEEGQWVFEFHPRAGEKLVANVTRPAAAEGGTLAIDSVRTNVQVGKRATDVALELQYRSTQGGRHTFALPGEARVTNVQSDGQNIAVRPDGGELTLGLLPGEHTIQIAWQQDEGVALHSRTPPVDLRAAASNLATHVQVPADRWVLLAFGAGVGPAILFWGELAVFVALAVLIGGSRFSPLRTHEWILLGLGLSTFSWLVLAIFAAWLFAMRWRETAAPEAPRVRFNLLQIALAVLSVVALASLVAAIPFGLLGTPDMRVGGAASGAGSYHWFVDQTGNGALPRPGVISISVWWYRAAMLAWALWLSFALLRWVPWAWRIWSRHGVWRKATPAGAS